MAEDSKVLGGDGTTGWKEFLNNFMAQSPFPLPTHCNVNIPYKLIRKNTLPPSKMDTQLIEDIPMVNNQIKRHEISLVISDIQNKSFLFCFFLFFFTHQMGKNVKV